MQKQKNYHTDFVKLLCWGLGLSLFSLSVQGQGKKSTHKPYTKAATVKETPRIVSYEVLENGDTINRLDQQNIRHGRWVVDIPARYEEPGSMEVGSYDQGVKVGNWKTYTTDGRLISDEQFRKGLLHGEARYFEEGRLVCVGNYIGLNAKQAYDTVMVEVAATGELKPVRVKTDVGSVKHGMWTFYEPGSKKIKRVMEYQADEVYYDKSYDGMSKSDSTYLLSKMKTFPHISKQHTNEAIWIQKGNQKRVRYTDIPDSTRSVKPNVRKKTD